MYYIKCADLDKTPVLPPVNSNKLLQKHFNIINVMKVYNIGIRLCLPICLITLLYIYFQTINEAINYESLCAVLLVDMLLFNKSHILDHFSTKSQSVLYVDSQSVLYVDDVDLNSNYMKEKEAEDKKYITLIANNNKYNISTVILKRSFKARHAFKLLYKFSQNICFMPAYYDESNKLKYICNSYIIHAYKIHNTKLIQFLELHWLLSISLSLIFSAIPTIIYISICKYYDYQLTMWIEGIIKYVINLLWRYNNIWIRILDVIYQILIRFVIILLISCIFILVYYLWNKLLTYILQRPYPKNDVLNYYMAVIHGRPYFLHNYNKYKYVVRVVNKKNKKNLAILDSVNNIYIESQ